MSSPKTHTPTSHLPGFDGLRAIACLAVFGVHFGQITRIAGSLGPFDLARFLTNGNTGVALFFALSGFLLSAPYWSAMLSGAKYPSLGRYFLRRAARILPGYFVCLTLLIIVNKYWQETDWQQTALAHYLLIFNYQDKTIFAINPPFWTVAVEAQFYLLLPMLFLLGKVFRPTLVMVSLLILATVAYGLHFGIAQTEITAQPLLGAQKELSPVVAYSLLAHMPHFLLGVVSGGVFVRLIKKPRQGSVFYVGSEALFWFSAAAIATILSTPLDTMTQIPYGRYHLPIVPLLICVVISLTALAPVACAVLDSMAFRGIGAISYGIYVYHLPIQHATARYMRHFSMNAQSDWLIFGIISFVLSIGVATVSYLIFERPILNLVKGSVEQSFKVAQQVQEPNGSPPSLG